MKHLVLALLMAAPSAFAADDRSSDEALVQAAEKLLSEDAVASTPTEPAKTDASKTDAGKTSDTAAAAGATSTPATADAKESDIPVFLSQKSSGGASSNIALRMVLSFVLLASVGGALWFANRRWGRTRDKGGNKARIEIMHQLHLGPRKSVALIRVAGEALLIGVTDQNVNMLKPVTLIDDELENAMSKDFNNFLEDEFSLQDVRTALQAQV